jgi:hypothetical protein
MQSFEHSDLLISAESLKSHLALRCRTSVGDTPRLNQFNGSARSGVAGALGARIVLIESTLRISGDACIEASVSAAKDIEVPIRRADFTH